MPSWSYSSIKTFSQCPKKYYHLKVAKDVKDTQGAEALFGEEAHAAAEHYIKHGTPIPGKYKVMRPAVEALAQFPVTWSPVASSTRPCGGVGSWTC
jgi:hypothetical protein